MPEIAIVGGGIGGLAAAAFLGRAGLPSTVYEQAGELTEVGAGLVVAPNAARLLRRLGVLEAFRREAVQLEVGWEFRRWLDGTVLSAEDLLIACERLYGEHTYTAHRAHLLDVIKSAVRAESIRLGKRCVEYAPRDGRPVLRFDDGEVVEPDIVIGADGVHSVVRRQLADPVPAHFSGISAFRALVPADRAPDFARRRRRSCGSGQDIMDGDRYGRGVPRRVRGWDPRLVDLIGAAGTPGRWALLDRAPLGRWSDATAALLGDAAHPTFPFFAQGAAQAIEDAAVLAACLAEDVDGPVRALRRYEAMRIPRTTRIQEISHGRAHLNHLPDGPEQIARDLAFTEADPLVANGWIYAYDPDVAMAAPGTSLAR